MQSLIFTAFIVTSIITVLPQNISLAESSIQGLDPVTATAPRLIAENRRDGYGRGEMMESLNLSESQRQRLSSIRQKYQQQMESVRRELLNNQKQLRELMSGTASEAAIRAKHQQVTTLRQKLGELRFESMLESRQVLNPDQRKQFSQMMNERRGQRRLR